MFLECNSTVLRKYDKNKHLWHHYSSNLNSIEYFAFHIFETVFSPINFWNRTFSTVMANCGEAFTFTWKIENFSCLHIHKTEEFLKSAKFIVESVMKSKWSLNLYLEKNVDEHNQGNNHISLFLRNHEDIPLTVFYYLDLDTTDGEFEVKKLKNVKKMTFSNIIFGYLLISPRRKILSLESLYKKKHLYLPQDVMTIKCCIYPDDNNNQISNNTKLSIYTILFKDSVLASLELRFKGDL